MGLLDTIRTWLGGRSSDAAQACPLEADLLNYKEGRLTPPQRARLERHFAACHDCREVLGLLARFPEEAIAQPPLTAAEIQQQTAHVLQYVEADQHRQTERATDKAAIASPRRIWGLGYAQFTVAGLLIAALVIGGLYVVTRPSATESAQQSLQLAMKDERRSAVRLSGGFAHSPYNETRGPDDSSDLHLRVALGQLKDIDSETAPVEQRQTLARVHLAFDIPEHARQALEILESLRARGVQSAELFNDLGVAQFQLQNNDAAIASFDQALSVNPKYSEALFNRAFVKYSAARYPEARRDWEQFINSTSDAAWRAEAEQRLSELSR
jgi:tetratricopeptide (TPR) repeat protein